MSNLSKAEKILVAAGRLVAAGKVEFSSEDLVVSAYESFPDDFAMKGYPHYPDSNQIFTRYMGKKAPLIVRGWLEKVGAKKLRVTPKGLNDLNQFEEGGGVEHETLARQLDEAMGNLLTSSAFNLAKDRKEKDITFHHFCRFVGLSAGDSWQAVQGKLIKASHLADEADRIGQAGRALRMFVKNRNMYFEAMDLVSLKPLLIYLTERFKPQMDEWRRNSGG